MIERRGKSWRARYHGPDGRERNKTFQRKIDAERWLAEQRSLITQGDWTEPALARITSASTHWPGWTREPISNLRPATSTSRC